MGFGEVKFPPSNRSPSRWHFPSKRTNICTNRALKHHINDPKHHKTTSQTSLLPIIHHFHAFRAHTKISKKSKIFGTQPTLHPPTHPDHPLNPRFETPTPPILAKKNLWDETKYVFQNHLMSSFNPRTPPRPEKSFKKSKKIQRNFAGIPYQIYSQIFTPRRGDPYTFPKIPKFSKNEFFRNSPDFYWGQGNRV